MTTVENYISENLTKVFHAIPPDKQLAFKLLGGVDRNSKVHFRFSRWFIASKIWTGDPSPELDPLNRLVKAVDDDDYATAAKEGITFLKGLSHAGSLEIDPKPWWL